LKKVIGEVKPTVLFVCYGTNAAMTEEKGWTDDPEGIGRTKGAEGSSSSSFLVGYDQLLDLMTAAAGESLREVVLVVPPPLENLGAPLPDQAERNEKLGKCGELIESLARTRDHRVVNLWKAMGGGNLKAGEKTPGPLTTNGVHYGDAGYMVIGEALVKGLGLSLPENLSPNAAPVVALRDTVKKKNRLFFHRWRPVNETYLFLFRKHEQGNNAVEIPMFDPLIAEEEKKIEALRAAVFTNLKQG
jgi:lysophospholipase L1-like esterase